MRKMTIVAAAVAVLAGNAAQAQPAVPAPANTAPTPAKSVRVMMLRWFTADVARAEKFYQAVFGMTTIQRMGDNVRIMLFPGGGLPGMILVQTNKPDRLKGSFVAQVPDVKATLAVAAANGARLLNTKFSDNIDGQTASSSHFEDPDGNVVEVLQMGGTAR